MAYFLVYPANIKISAILKAFDSISIMSGLELVFEGPFTLHRFQLKT